MCHIIYLFYLIIIAGALTDLRVVGYNGSRVNLAWRNPNYPAPSFPYLIQTIKSGEVIISLDATFLKEEDPVLSIDLRGNECERVEITVAVYGVEEETQTVNITLPSC